MRGGGLSGLGVPLTVAAAVFCIAGQRQAHGAADVATVKIRLARPGSPLYANVGGKERKIAASALKAWVTEGGRAIVYSTKGGAGGYENEGQALYLYDTATGERRKIMSEYFVVEAVKEATTTGGKKALVVEMRDGGLGASHLAVVDPARGEVFSADGAKLIDVQGNTISIGLYHDDDWDKLREHQKIVPYKTDRYDLDEILRRTVIINK